MTRTLRQLEHVKMGDMTPEERRMVTNNAVAKIQKELNEKAPKIEAILTDVLGINRGFRKMGRKSNG